MLKARLYIKDSLKFYFNKLELVLLTKELLSLAKTTNFSHKNYLEEKKNLKKKLKKNGKDEDENKLRLKKEIQFNNKKK
jgi:hypothetical protein